jgi:hypothetical protein
MSKKEPVGNPIGSGSFGRGCLKGLIGMTQPPREANAFLARKDAFFAIESPEMLD